MIHNRARIENAKLRYGSASLPISIWMTAQGMAVKNVDIEITRVKANIPYDDWFNSLSTFFLMFVIGLGIFGA
ncbi:hypothetical protein H5T51_07285 [Candidatus Bathyarchaeota archaeon]|nr:hypothetical protein [Candidatus Bathyarchaeota archaeon]